MFRHTLALILTLAAANARAEEEFTLIGHFSWSTELLAELSGLEITDDGNGFLAVGDRGWWVEGRLLRERDVISEVIVTRIEGIKGPNGFPVAARRVGDWADSEGLSLAPDGTAWVSFERWAHVWRFDAPFEPAKFVKDHPTFRDLADNWQLEAIAVDPLGRAYVFPEKPTTLGFPVYRLGADDLWVNDGYLPERDVFAIVGADFAPDGTLYLLERKLVVGLWWQSRIRRVRLDGSVDETLWTSDRGEFDNLEGLSVWDDGEGLRFTLVSDNNGGKTTPTEFVEFRLTE
ncbi:esterase-like activity of phytase family protein [Rhodobacteraceae bacterium]|nr:esterase-like activity of phytase family protein [Paracoccaceae bacterium]